MAVHYHHNRHYSKPCHGGHGDPLLMAATTSAAVASKREEANEGEASTPTATAGCGDPLFYEVLHHHPRPVQLVPSYHEFRLGQGDPLLGAAMKHWQADMIPHIPVQHPSNNVRSSSKARRNLNDILRLLGSPLYGWICYFHDMLLHDRMDIQGCCMALTSPLFGWVDYYNNVLHFDRTRYTDHMDPVFDDDEMSMPSVPSLDIDQADDFEELEETSGTKNVTGTIITAAQGDPLMEAAMKHFSGHQLAARNDAESRTRTIETDPVYREVCYHDPRPTQVVPRYEEFRLGHGDPLLKAAMWHHKQDMIFTPNSPRPSIDSGSVDAERIKSTALSLPIYDWAPYYTDVVHLDKTKLSSSTREGSNAVHKDPNSPKGITELRQHGSPLCYYNDHVHIGKDTITFPCLPSEE